MQQQVLQDKKRAAHIIAGELTQLLHDAAKMTGITYYCKLTPQTLARINIKDIKLAWVQDGGEANMQYSAWIFYCYGSEIHNFPKHVHMKVKRTWGYSMRTVWYDKLFTGSKGNGAMDILPIYCILVILTPFEHVPKRS